MKKRNQICIAFGLLLALGASLTACSAKFTSATVAETTAASMERAMYEKGGIAEAMDMNASVAEAAGGSADGSPLQASNGIQPLSTSRKLIRNVNLDVETDGFDPLLTSINDNVTSLGGYLEQTDISGNSISADSGQRRHASITARIPADHLDAFISQIHALGNITYRSENVQDVTLQYSDVESRKKSLTIEQERLWTLLEKADTMDGIIALEERLSEIRYQLESLESQLRTYDNQVDYSTIYLNIREVKVFTPTTPDSVMTRIQKGFQRNLERVGSGLVNTFVWLVASLPVLAVWAIVLIIAGLFLRMLMRRSKRNSQAAKMPGKNNTFPAQKDPNDVPAAPDQESQQQ